LLTKSFTERQIGLSELKKHKYNVISQTILNNKGHSPNIVPDDIFFLDKNKYVKSTAEIEQSKEMTMRGEKFTKEQHIAKLKEKMYGDDFLES